MKKYAVIVAGGSGSRMKSNLPKQFMLLNGKPVLYYTLRTFLNAFSDMEVILVLPHDHVAAGQEIIDAFFGYKKIRIAIGGQSRFHSVQNGLKLVEEESVVFVHDAVRCLLTADLIKRCYYTVLEYGTAVPVIPSNDSVRLITDNGNEPLQRDLVKLVQTPQAFLSTVLLPAYQIDFKEQFTDEATVVEAYGIKIQLLEGEENNFKITRPADLEFAKKLLNGL